MKSKLSYRAFSDNVKTTNLSCEAFRAHDTRYQGVQQKGDLPPSVFTTVLGAMNNRSVQHAMPSTLQFELYQRYYFLLFPFSHMLQMQLRH